ncbi:uncharacterized protein LOC107604929 isoform X2 [Arachis ipaensis]|uniref:uncharacterized protein LOC107604929 isoform X2 n=1 Tax=Arachis ipaensis TaxID=130454 RepID=UPI0007AF92FD|nr:uncharacterized protein LOC107604929 isoform X2 [Arachis ipaensis]
MSATMLYMISSSYPKAMSPRAGFSSLLVGEIGKSTPSEPNFLAQLAQDNWPSVLFAMGGGVVLSLGNLASQYAFAFVGLSITEVITASITVVIGTSLNYFLDGKINRAEILFPGVGCFLIAVCLGSDVHSSNTADNKVKLSNLSSDYNAGSVDSFTEGGLDVICTDRTLVFYEKQENLSKLWDILAIYAWLDKDVVYGQGTPCRHLLTTGWSNFVIQKKLVAGDSIVFLRAKDGDLCVGIQRAKKVVVGGGEVSVSLVVEAVSCGVNGRPFEVVYYPRGSSPEFCVKASIVRDAMKVRWCFGMRFKMPFETEDSFRIS